MECKKMGVAPAIKCKKDNFAAVVRCNEIGVTPAIKCKKYITISNAMQCKSQE